MITVAFLGLGKMGYAMAGRISRKHPTLVWNRTARRAQQHQTEFGSTQLTQFRDLRHAQVIMTCLPTSTEVVPVVRWARRFNKTAVYVDCTSGDPDVTNQLGNLLAAPVSGGPQGAREGTLSVIVSGDPQSQAIADPVLRCFGQNITSVGHVPGAAHAVKAVNNALNTTQLLLAAEGLCMLQKAGVDPVVAAHAIRHSSGNSRVLQDRIPAEVFTRQFDYGFSLGLMKKDVDIAMDLYRRYIGSSPVVQTTQDALHEACLKYGDLVDYTEIVKLVEDRTTSTLSPTLTLAETDLAAQIER